MRPAKFFLNSTRSLICASELLIDIDQQRAKIDLFYRDAELHCSPSFIEIEDNRLRKPISGEYNFYIFPRKTIPEAGWAIKAGQETEGRRRGARHRSEAAGSGNAPRRQSRARISRQRFVASPSPLHLTSNVPTTRYRVTPALVSFDFTRTERESWVVASL